MAVFAVRAGGSHNCVTDAHVWRPAYYLRLVVVSGCVNQTRISAILPDCVVSRTGATAGRKYSLNVNKLETYTYHNSSGAWAFLELTHPLLVKKFPPIMEPTSSLPHSQESSTCSYPEQDQSSPCPIPLLECTFCYYPPIYT